MQYLKDAILTVNVNGEWSAIMTTVWACYVC